MNNTENKHEESLWDYFMGLGFYGQVISLTLAVVLIYALISIPIDFENVL